MAVPAAARRAESETSDENTSRKESSRADGGTGSLAGAVTSPPELGSEEGPLADAATWPPGPGSGTLLLEEDAEVLEDWCQAKGQRRAR